MITPLPPYLLLNTTILFARDTALLSEVDTLTR